VKAPVSSRRGRNAIAIAVAFGAGALAVGFGAWRTRGEDARSTATTATTATANAASAASAALASDRSVGASPSGIGAPADATTAIAIVTAVWGSGAGQLGRTRPEQANPEAPMSLAAAGDGLVVLDQVNGRVVRFDARGNAIGTVRATPTTQDVAVTKEGGLALLDRLARKEVTIVDARGNEMGKLPLVGKGIEDPGLTTGVFVDGERVYAERSHGGLVLLGTSDGTPAKDRTELSGRPSRDGTLLLSAGITSPERGRLYLNVFDRKKNALRFTRTIDVTPRVSGVALLDSDAGGIIYLGVVRASGDAEEIRVGCHDPNDGRELGAVTLPASRMPEETFKDLALMPDGRIVVAVRSEQGVDYRIARCP
jgi:hypothetical protein